MATYIPVTNLPTQFFDADGAPLTGGSLEFYLAGTTTATDLFSDSSGTSIGESIDLNSLGYPESGGNLITLFRDQSRALKIVCLDSVGATIYTMDNIPAVASFDSEASAKLGFITVTQDVDLDQMESDIAALLPASGGTITGDITLGPGVFLNSSVTAGIAASTTQAQGNGPLISAVNEVNIVATDNDTVTLPETVTGREVTVINNGANALQIFPPEDSYIDALAVDTATTLASGNTAVFKAYSSTKWESGKYSGLASTVTVAAATHDLGDEDIVFVGYTATGTVALTLMTDQVIDGRIVDVKDSGGNSSAFNITIDTEGAETIDGAATLVIAGDYDSATLCSDGTNWFIK